MKRMKRLIPLLALLLLFGTLLTACSFLPEEAQGNANKTTGNGGRTEMTTTATTTAHDLVTWTKYTGLDPEVSSGRGQVAQDNSRTPRSRRLTFGVTVNF